MKKIQKPNEPPPPVYQDILSPQINVPEINTTEPEMQRQIPSKTKSGYNLKKIKAMKHLLRDDKLTLQEQLYEEDVQESILKLLVPGKHQLNKEILLVVLQMAEDYFAYGTEQERTEYKQKSIYKMIQPYYRDDPEILDLGIEAVWTKVKKSTKFSRFKRRCYLKLKQFLAGSFFLM